MESDRNNNLLQVLVLRGGSDEGVTLHGTTSSVPAKLYLPGLLDTTILRTNKVCRVVVHIAVCAGFSGFG